MMLTEVGIGFERLKMRSVSSKRSSLAHLLVFQRALPSQQEEWPLLLKLDVSNHATSYYVQSFDHVDDKLYHGL